jgi:hypothetical protein
MASDTAIPALAADGGEMGQTKINRTRVGRAVSALLRVSFVLHEYSGIDLGVCPV